MASSRSPSRCSSSSSRSRRSAVASLPALAEQWHEFLGYLISFVFIGGIWVSHAGMTKLMRHADTLAYGIDLLMLLFVGVLPFSTNLMVTHLSGPDVEAAVVIYGVNVLLASLDPEPAHVLHRP